MVEPTSDASENEPFAVESSAATCGAEQHAALTHTCTRLVQVADGLLVVAAARGRSLGQQACRLAGSIGVAQVSKPLWWNRR